jgi:hypothetical protein
MSWYIDVVGTKAGVARHVTEKLAHAEAMYAGKPEGDDVRAAKERILALIEACDLESDTYAVKVSARGSHSWNTKGLMSASMSIEVTRAALAIT